MKEDLIKQYLILVLKKIIFFFETFYWIEYTSDNASYFLTGIYLEDNLGQLIYGKKNNYIFLQVLDLDIMIMVQEKTLVMIFSLEQL